MSQGDNLHVAAITLRKYENRNWERIASIAAGFRRRFITVAVARNAMCSHSFSEGAEHVEISDQAEFHRSTAFFLSF